MTILRAQVESNEQGLCRCGQRATSELSYAKEMDQRQDALSVSPLSLPLSPPTDGSYQTPNVESVVGHGNNLHIICKDIASQR